MKQAILERERRIAIQTLLTCLHSPYGVRSYQRDARQCNLTIMQRCGVRGAGAGERGCDWHEESSSFAWSVCLSVCGYRIACLGRIVP